MPGIVLGSGEVSRINLGKGTYHSECPMFVIYFDLIECNPHQKVSEGYIISLILQ